MVIAADEVSSQELRRIGAVINELCTDEYVETELGGAFRSAVTLVMVSVRATVKTWRKNTVIEPCRTLCEQTVLVQQLASGLGNL